MSKPWGAVWDGHSRVGYSSKDAQQARTNDASVSIYPSSLLPTSVRVSGTCTYATLIQYRRTRTYNDVRDDQADSELHPVIATTISEVSQPSPALHCFCLGRHLEKGEGYADRSLRIGLSRDRDVGVSCRPGNASHVF